MSLTDALDRLAHESDQLAYHASQNTAQAGPFTTAYLYLEPESNVLSLIRDAAPKEKRPFKILSAPNPPPNQPDLGDKRPGVQLKTESVLTPLKSLRARRGQPGELDATLRAAEELLAAIADSYHMAKYQAHVRALAQQHAEQQRELAALQAEIQAFANRPAVVPEPEPEREEVSVDDAIRAEEAALRELERSIAPLRRAPPSPASPRSPRSPMTRAPRSPQPRSSVAPKTPAKTPAKVTATPNRTFQFPGTTPRRPAQTPRGRFEPLSLFGTPRAKTPQVPAPALRESIRRDEPMGRSIFGPGRRSTQNALDASVRKTPQRLDASTKGLEASTSQRSLGASTGSAAREPEPSLAASTLQPPSLGASLGASANAPATPAHAPPTPAAAAPTPAPPTPAPPTPASEPTDIDAANPAVVSGVATVHDKLADVMRMLTPGGRDVASTVSHLQAVLNADVPSPPTPGAVTQEAVLMASAALSLLRAAEGGVPMPVLKADLATTARVRGWSEDAAQRTIYAGVGRKAWKIDRRAGGGGRVHLT